MARASAANSQLSIGPVELRVSEQPEPTFRKAEHETDALSESEQLSALLIDAAMKGAHMTNKDVAHALGISVSLVEKWRSREARGCPSFVQILSLGIGFHFHLFVAMNRHFGYGRRVLVRLLDDLGALAIAE